MLIHLDVALVSICNVLLLLKDAYVGLEPRNEVLPTDMSQLLRSSAQYSLVKLFAHRALDLYLRFHHLLTHVLQVVISVLENEVLSYATPTMAFLIEIHAL